VKAANPNHKLISRRSYADAQKQVQPLPGLTATAAISGALPNGRPMTLAKP
jgi:hypothetical protein